MLLSIAVIACVRFADLRRFTMRGLHNKMLPTARTLNGVEKDLRPDANSSNHALASAKALSIAGSGVLGPSPPLTMSRISTPRLLTVNGTSRNRWSTLCSAALPGPAHGTDIFQSESNTFVRQHCLF